MDLKKVSTGICIFGGVLGSVCSVLGIVQTVDQIKNGVKLRDDQLATLSNSISNQVSANVINNFDTLADSIIMKAKESNKQN